MKKIKISDKYIGDSESPFIIAEIGQAHEGSLGIAHSYIDAVSKTGADAIKFQTHYAEEESTLDEKFRIKFSYEDKSRYDYWKRMEFDKNEWKELYDHAKDLGLIFLSSPFSNKSFEILNNIGIPAWKLGSGEFKSNSLLKKMVKSNKPILFSTGMSSMNEISRFYKFLKDHNSEFAIFQCTSQYPTKPSNVGLNLITEFKKLFNVPIGLSDHTGKIFSPLAALSLGASIIEVHVTFNKQMFGPDISSSIDIEDLSFLVNAKNEIFKYLSNPVDKDKMSLKLKNMRDIFSKSLTLSKNLKAGEIIKKEHLIEKKPGTGIPISKINDIVGKKLINDFDSKYLLKWSDFK